MPNGDDKWIQFSIRVYSDACAGDARRVEFERHGHTTHPASVVLRGGGELLVTYTPPQPEIAGITRDDFVTKAAAMVRWTGGRIP